MYHCRLQPLLLFVLLSLPVASRALEPPVILPITEPGTEESHRIVWATDPGVLYELEQSADLKNWSLVAGFPREAEGMTEDHPFSTASDRLFFRVRRIEDSSAPEGFVYIPAGAYSRGDHHDETESWMARSRPVHDIYVRGFLMAETPVTYAAWRQVFDWAVMNGYQFDNVGQRGSDAAYNGLPAGPGNDLHPVVQINWYDMVKWCNARSEMQGLQPAYYTDASKTIIYRSGRHDVTNDQVDWRASGDRLPTAAESEKASRGGLPGKRWPWGDEPIAGTRANYLDSSETNGTTPVGFYQPNAYGLYDVAGNVWERCWDWFDADWYNKTGATEPDSKGAFSGAYRVARGSSWNFSPDYCRTAYFGASEPATRGNSWGFRVARSKSF